MRGLFITGTDTGIGKTTICTGLLWLLRNKQIDVGVMKPFAAARGIFSDKYRSEDTYRLAEAAGQELRDKQINPFFYRVPASPLVASRLTGKKVPSLNRVVKQVVNESKKHRYMVIEGIGGIMVPISYTYTLADFASYLRFSAVIVAGAKLGTLNHTLLTYEACVNHQVDVIAIIINRMPRRPEKSEKLVVSTIRRLTGIKSTFSVPEFEADPNAKSVGSVLGKKWDLSHALML